MIHNGWQTRPRNGHSHENTKSKDTRSRIAQIFVFILGGIIIFRLFFLMILEHSFYQRLAEGSHEAYSQLFPKRGRILIQDSRTSEEYPVALNRDYFLVYADTRAIKDDKTAEEVLKKLTEVFSYDEEKQKQVLGMLNKRTDPYEPIEQKIDEDTQKRLMGMNLPGIATVRRSYRYYPEKKLASHVVGFLGRDKDGKDIGRYGVEGYWNEVLTGSSGFLEGIKSATGKLLTFANIDKSPAKDGADILLTIDRTVQYRACERLYQGMLEYGAASASLIIMDPQTGAIRAMCSFPDFDPNEYGKVDSVEMYNNSSIFTPYEPGSIFKPITMAAAINEGKVGPQSPFHDSGSRDGLCTKPIRNAEDKVYNDTDMTGVLENSINTGMIYVAELLGTNKFRDYVEKFGFGIKEGIELDTEASGVIDSLSKNKKDKIDCYTATGSFGQGLTVTPLQMVTAYSAIANGGKLMKPYIVQEVRQSDGSTEKIKPKVLRQILDPRTSKLLGGMLVNVVEKGHAKQARQEHYYLAGKTGTAQIPGPGGYSADTIHSFVGFAPADDPKLVMIVKYEKPQRKYAESTAVPVFGDIMKFLLQYYQIPPAR